ncbi:hypothetical protein, partial [Pseudomonas sp. FR229a]|uniref:hypothetical protein n=1 Tax=Pseudomonas sp. FR229a TaxID=3040313 RepID=UPI002556B67A
SLRSHARINPSAQPSDVAGGSRSKAGELTLGLEVDAETVGAAEGCDLLIFLALALVGVSLLAIAISKCPIPTLRACPQMRCVIQCIIA